MRFVVAVVVVLVALGCSLLNDLDTIGYAEDAGQVCSAAALADGGVADVDGAALVCTPSECHNGRLDGAETDVDCGGSGPCARCGSKQRCQQASDCLTGFCAGGLCLSPTCADGTQNGDESDVDCGGSCAGCGLTARCLDHEDCATNSCFDNACIEASCDDSLKNGLETGVDCGGPECSEPCGMGEGCKNNSDCISLFCNPGTEPKVCGAAVCDDARKNGLETDVDCGGAECEPCGQGQGCVVHDDCLDKNCVDGICRIPRCDNGKLDGDEVDVDCGGLACPGCAEGSPCRDYEDCASLICTEEICEEGSCSDEVRNGDETDVDCGGDDCPPCTVNHTCDNSIDCDTEVCIESVCRRPSCADGRVNGDESSVDCGGSICLGCALGQSCVFHADCASGFCSSQTCRQRENGLLASYYEGRRFDRLFATRVDEDVDFNWGVESPMAGMPADDFSVRWRGDVHAEFSETYEFCVDSDDGHRLWVDNRLILDHWWVAVHFNCASIQLEAGKYYPIILELFEAQGSARARLQWQSPSQAREVIPEAALLPTEVQVDL